MCLLANSETLDTSSYNAKNKTESSSIIAILLFHILIQDKQNKYNRMRKRMNSARKERTKLPVFAENDVI